MKRLIPLFLILILISGISGCRKKSPDQYLQMAEQKLRQRDFIGARIDLKEILRKYPDQPAADQARFLLAQCYFAERDFVQCRSHMKVIFKKYGPNDIRGRQAFEFILNTYRMEKKFADGILEAKRILTNIPPENEFAFTVNLMIGDLMVEDNRTTEAIRHLQNLVENQEDHQMRTAAMERQISIFIGQNKIDEAIRVYGDYAVKYPDYENINDLFAGQAYFYSKKGDQEKADELFEKAMNGYNRAIEKTLDKSRKSDLAFRQAKSYELFNKFPEAREKYRFIIEEYPGTPPELHSRLSLGDTYYLEGDKEQAMKYFQQLLESQPENPELVKMVRGRIASLMRIRAAEEQRDATTTGTQDKKTMVEKP